MDSLVKRIDAFVRSSLYFSDSWLSESSKEMYFIGIIWSFDWPFIIITPIIWISFQFLWSINFFFCKRWWIGDGGKKGI